jgi:glycosyltransferase involved in cell wall biosynthesis
LKNKNYKNSEFEVRHIPAFDWNKTRTFFTFLNSLKYFFSEKPYIIISATWQNAVGLLPMKKIFNFQLITFAHGRDVANINTNNVSKCIKVVENTDVFFAVSDFLKIMIESKIKNIPTNKVEVLPNGANPNLFYPREIPSSFYKEFDINKNSVSILSVGRMIKLKEYETIIKAIPILIEQNLDIQLIIISPFESNSRYYLFLQKIIGELNVGEKVKIIGSQSPETLAKFYSIADLYVQSTGRDKFNNQEEGLSMTVIEAQFCGAPVVVTRSGGMPGAVAPDLGRVIEIGDVDSLAEIIVDVASNPKKYKEIGIKSAEYMRENFSWEIIVNKFLENIGEK